MTTDAHTTIDIGGGLRNPTDLVSRAANDRYLAAQGGSTTGIFGAGSTTMSQISSVQTIPPAQSTVFAAAPQAATDGCYATLNTQ